MNRNFGVNNDTHSKKSKPIICNLSSNSGMRKKDLIIRLNSSNVMAHLMDNILSFLSRMLSYTLTCHLFQGSIKSYDACLLSIPVYIQPWPKILGTLHF